MVPRSGSARPAQIQGEVGQPDQNRTRIQRLAERSQHSLDGPPYLRVKKRSVFARLKAAIGKNRVDTNEV